MKDLSALNAPANYGGTNAPVTENYAATSLETTKAVNAKTAAKETTGSPEARNVMHWAAGIVVAALVLLWFFGGIVFRDVNL